ncbi:MAG: 30S ribosomal protein S4 [bacterium]
MGRNLEPKCKQCRRLGEKLFLKGDRCQSAKCGMVKRNFPPGFHGSKGRGKQTEFGMQLAEKQKALKQYRMMEKQFKLTYLKAQKMQGNKSDNFLKLLEMRLDNAIYRLGFTVSRDKARQLISHGHFTVNAQKVNIPSYSVKTGDVIAVKESSKRGKEFNTLTEKIKQVKTPSWLNLEPTKLAGKVLHAPVKEDLQTNFNAQLIVEFYSR